MSLLFKIVSNTIILLRITLHHASHHEFGTSHHIILIMISDILCAPSLSKSCIVFRVNGIQDSHNSLAMLIFKIVSFAVRLMRILLFHGCHVLIALENG